MDKVKSVLSATTSFPSQVLGSLQQQITSPLNSPLSKIATSIATGLEKLNMDIDENIVTLEQVLDGYDFIKSCPDVVRTPLISHVQDLFKETIRETGPDLSNVDLFMKMENMQTTGSFKIRGVVNQMRKVKERHGKDASLITMSAGNYGKAFAFSVGKSSPRCVCVMPKTAPEQRGILIKSMGVDVVKTEPSQIQVEVDRMVAEEGFVYCHPFDDVDLIAGYGSAALEVLEEVPNPDVIIVCCGGGGLVSGIAAAVSLAKVKGCRVYAVEPESAPTMYESFKNRRAMTVPGAKSIAAGLAPPFAGSLCYKHCRWFVDDVCLVSEEDIVYAMKVLYNRGITAEPSGCAAFAALICGKVPDVEGKKVVVYITGGNVSPTELANLLSE